MEHLNCENEFELIRNMEKRGSSSKNFYFIPSKWLNNWRNYAVKRAKHPGMISFGDFFDNKGNLKSTLALKIDYQALNSDQWNYLKLKYSTDNEFSSEFKNIYNKSDVPLIESQKNLDPAPKPPLRPHTGMRSIQVFEKKENVSRRTESKESKRESSLTSQDTLYKTAQSNYNLMKKVSESQTIQMRPIRSSTPISIKKPRQETSNPAKKDQISTPTQEASTRLSLISRNLSKSVLKFGIYNPRFQCFMNTVLQCLFSFDSFVSRVEKDAPGPISRSLNSAVKEGRLMRGQDGYVTCQTLPAIFSKTFPGYKQHDAPEFCRALLDRLNEEFPKNPSIPARAKLNACSASWESFRSQFSPIISDEFLGMLCSTVSCLSCGNESYSYEPFTMLMLELTRRLETSISEFLKEEVISNYKCEKCRKNTKIKKCFQLNKLPKCLLIQLKRFRYSTVPVKLENKCEFGLALSVIDQEGEFYKYELVAVGVHLGSVLGGHYFAYCARDKWYRFDDETVSEVDISRVIASQAYLLCYKLVQ